MDFKGFDMQNLVRAVASMRAGVDVETGVVEVDETAESDTKVSPDFCSLLSLDETRFSLSLASNRLVRNNSFVRLAPRRNALRVNDSAREIRLVDWRSLYLTSSRT